MGNSNQRQVGVQVSQDPRTYIQSDLPKFVIQSRLGNGKFMKSYHMKADGLSLVVKVYMKMPEEDLQAVASRLTQIHRLLSPAKYPCLLPYQMWIKSSVKLPKTNTSPVYLIRQYFISNLYDRLYSRPFLSEIEKMWIIYQLFIALEIIHSCQMIHGDLKLENIMITSWNWLVLTDFAGIKPIAIPDDDPTDFQYYFDTMNRQRCSIAPERFYNSAISASLAPEAAAGSIAELKEMDKNQIFASSEQRGATTTPPPGVSTDSTSSPAMDVFSCGCAIAEVLLDGDALLDLPAMVKYMASEDGNASTNPMGSLDHVDSPITSILNRISSSELRKLVVDMTQKDPLKRKTIKDYREVCVEAGIMPTYFDTALYPLFNKLHTEGWSPDDRICLLCQEYGTLMSQICGTNGGEVDVLAANFFSTAATTYLKNAVNTHSSVNKNSKQPSATRANSTDLPKENKKMMSVDELIEQCRSLIAEVSSPAAPSAKEGDVNGMPEGATRGNVMDTLQTAATLHRNDNPHAPHFAHSLLQEQSNQVERKCIPGIVILVQVVCANIRSVKFPQFKILCLMLLVRFGMWCSDSVIAHRIIPVVVAVLDDPAPPVKATALRALCTLLSIIQTVSSLESNIFTLRIFPAMSTIAKDMDVVVRVAFAESIGRLAEAAKRFLDYSHFLLVSKSLATSKSMGEGVTGEGLIPSSGPITAASLHLPLIDGSYDLKLKVLLDQISRWIHGLSLDSGISSDSARGSGLASHGSMIKRVLLADIMRLCVFFGEEMTVDLLLTQLLTFLNDQDWELRLAFCSQIPYVCAFLGPTVTVECILPCIENALVDVEEKVVVRAVKCLETLVQMDLLMKMAVVECVSNVVCLLLHPCIALRDAVISLVCAAAKLFGDVDVLVFILPLIRPCLAKDLLGVRLTKENLTIALTNPLPRGVFKLALTDRLHPGGDVQVGEGHNSPLSGVSPEDAAKLAIMKTYIDRAASELRTKIIQWKNGALSGLNTVIGSNYSLQRHSSRPASHPVNGADEAIEINQEACNILTIPASRIPEHCVQTLYIPHQKNGLYQPITEELRTIACTYGHQQPSTASSNGRRGAAWGVPKIKALFGVSTSHQEAARVLAMASSTAEMGLNMSRDAMGRQMTTSDKSSLIAAATNSATGAAGNQTSTGVATTAMTDYAIALQLRLKALGVPPLPVDLGILCQPDGRRYNSYTESLELSVAADSATRAFWRPKENVLVCSLLEHTKAVHRLSVSPDQSYFISASADKTAKVWHVKGLDRTAFPRSILTYGNHKGKLLDAICVENSHGVATCSDDGAIHVWRVDVNSPMSYQDSGNGYYDAPIQDTVVSYRSGLSVSGMSVVKTIDQLDEGAVTGLLHYNGDSASVLNYVTQYGGLHGWDLRCSKEPFHFKIRPELGLPTCLTAAPDRNWLCVGTSEGYVQLYDIRYNVPCKVWRHSSLQPINRLACCKSIPKSPGKEIMPYTEGAYLFVAAGENESSVFGLPEGGECLKCFRSLPMVQSRSPVAKLPVLSDVAMPGHPMGGWVATSSGGSAHRFRHTLPGSTFQSPPRASSVFTSLDDPLPSCKPSVRAMMGRISQSGSSYLVTAGTDKHIRFWDFSSPSKCFTVSGLDPGQPKSAFEAINTAPTTAEAGGGGSRGITTTRDAGNAASASSTKLFVSYEASLPSAETLVQAQVPHWQSRGPVLPSTNFKDAILDLKSVDLPIRMLLSSGRDGDIKLWR